jgi:hypothetical protein
MRTVPMFASPAVHTRRAASAAQLREKYFGIRQFSSRDLAVQRNDHHPCWKAAHFLPCTRPPDVMRMSRPQRRRTFGPSERRAFVATRSGLQTMPSGGHEHEEDTVAATSFGDVRPPATQAQSVIVLATCRLLLRLPQPTHTAPKSPTTLVWATSHLHRLLVSEIYSRFAATSCPSSARAIFGLSSSLLSSGPPSLLRKSSCMLPCAHLLSLLTLLVPRPFCSTGFGKRSKTLPALSAPSSKCSPPNMTLPPPAVLMLGNPSSLCSRQR